MVKTPIFLLVISSLTSVAFAAGGSCPASVPAGVTSCYYADSASGSDSNTGTSESSPWQHLPGMTGCSGNCASTTPAAGEGFIAKGGSTWHQSSGTPTGLPWNWNWSGTSSAPVYIGVDTGWYSGSAWARPILTEDNPLSSVMLTSCTYDDSTTEAVKLSGSYITFDNFELTGKCWSGRTSVPSDGSGAYGLVDIRSLTHGNILDNYIHGWSSTESSVDSNYMILGTADQVATYNRLAYNVIDGSDAMHGTTTAADQCGTKSFNGPPCQSGFAIYGDAYNFDHNVLRYVSNGIIANNMVSVHDNVFEYMWNSYDGETHPNVDEAAGAVPGATQYFYNNIIRHTYQNVGFWPEISTIAYEFNNVFFDNTDGLGGADINCFMQSPVTSSSTPTIYIYNNTFVGDTASCDFNFFAGNGSTPGWAGTAYFENNHIIDSHTSLSSLVNCGSSCFTDNGGEVLQTVSAANAQGYSATNNYAPTASTDATIGKGTNLTSQCSTFSSDSALCSGTTDGVGLSTSNVAVSPAIAAIARPSTGAWNSGAYQFGNQVAPAPPTNLTGTVKPGS